MIEHAFGLRTDLFEVTRPGPHFINPRCFGEDFAIWLRDQAKTIGWDLSKPIAEDWGWALLLPHQGRTYTISIGVMDDSIGHVPAEWRVGIAYERPMNSIRAWLAASPTVELQELTNALETILRKESRFHEVVPE